jgi:hypothetical protein
VFQFARLNKMIAVAASLMLSAIALQAQGSGKDVVPGITLHIEHPTRIDTVVYARSITRAGQDSSTGTRTVVTRAFTGADGNYMLEVEQRFPAGGGEIVDTAIDELHTLRAFAHRSHQPTRTMSFDFRADGASGTVTFKTASGDSVANVNQNVGGAIFDSNVIDLVVAALPLRSGFSGDLPFFIYERGGRVVIPVSVRDHASIPFARLGKRDTWVVSVGVPGAPATIWVDSETRAVLRVRYDIIARGMSFTDERITPLRG